MHIKLQIEQNSHTHHMDFFSVIYWHYNKTFLCKLFINLLVFQRNVMVNVTKTIPPQTKQSNDMCVSITVIW